MLIVIDEYYTEGTNVMKIYIKVSLDRIVIDLLITIYFVKNFYNYMYE